LLEDLEKSNSQQPELERLANADSPCLRPVPHQGFFASWPTVLLYHAILTLLRGLSKVPHCGAPSSRKPGEGSDMVHLPTLLVMRGDLSARCRSARRTHLSLWYPVSGAACQSSSLPSMSRKGRCLCTEIGLESIFQVGMRNIRESLSCGLEPCRLVTMMLMHLKDGSLLTHRAPYPVCFQR
jgi:hypothetical protein